MGKRFGEIPEYISDRWAMFRVRLSRGYWHVIFEAPIDSVILALNLATGKIHVSLPSEYM
jgi:hypothetical protein